MGIRFIYYHFSIPDSRYGDTDISAFLLGHRRYCFLQIHYLLAHHSLFFRSPFVYWLIILSILQELDHQVTAIHKVAAEVFGETGTTLDYKVGTMIEIPRAALVADQVHIFFR